MVHLVWALKPHTVSICGQLIRPSGLLSLWLQAKICFKSFHIFRLRHTMCLHRTRPSHSVNMIRSAHHVVSHTESTHVFTRGQFWPLGIVITCICVCPCVCVSLCQSLACPCDNSGPVQARIAKFWPKMQKTLVKVPIAFGGNWPWWPWPSRSNLT